MSASEHYRVSDRERAAFAEDGAVVLRGVVDESRLERLRPAIDQNLIQGEYYFHYIYVWQRDPELADFCFESSLPRIAAQLLDTNKVNLLYDQIFVKDAGETERTSWHNDQPYWPVRGSTMSIWLAVDEVTEETGALELIRASHRWDRWFEIIGEIEPPRPNSAFEKIPDFEAERDRHELLSWDLAPGDAIAFYGLTVHGAHGNRRPGYRRRGYALRFAGAEATYYEGPGPLERFCDPSKRHGEALDGEKYPVVCEVGT